jgi:predicted TIM-barrel fold metal-dependent hydrolase
MWPFDNSAMSAKNIDMGTYIPMQSAKLTKELGKVGLSALPADLASYQAFITKSLEQNRAGGSVAIKFEAAYFRSLYFADPPEEVAAQVYAKYRAGGVPTNAEYTAFQDYILRYLVREAGRLHEAVQFHTAIGIGDYFSLQGGRVMNLENLVKDPRYDSVTFVLVHAGHPYEREVPWLTAKKNVHMESSFTGMVQVPSQFKEVLKQWLMTYPSRVSFGSDAFPYNEAVGVEESYWMAVNAARQSLAGALAELVEEHAITEAEAIHMAHGFLHDNAAALYPTATPAK